MQRGRPPVPGNPGSYPRPSTLKGAGPAAQKGELQSATGGLPETWTGLKDDRVTAWTWTRL
eukprot:1161058-Pelagomonas_calceolata.AAC.2